MCDDSGTSTAASRLEGLAVSALERHLAPSIFPEPYLRRWYEMIAQGAGREVLTPHPAQAGGRPSDASCMVDGPARSLVWGRGNEPSTFEEQEERLSFFPKPGFAPEAAQEVDLWSDDGQVEVRRAVLSRDASYKYWLDGQEVRLVTSMRAFVHLETIGAADRRQKRTLAAPVFWGVVFGVEEHEPAHFRTQVSAAHVAALLALNLKMTVARHIGAGHLPAVKHLPRSPGITRGALEQFLAYREAFPQGSPNARRVAAWRESWRQSYQGREPRAAGLHHQAKRE